MPDLIKLTEDRRKSIANTLGEFVEFGTSLIGQADTWWTAVERFHRNEMPSTFDVLDKGPDDPGYAQFHWPFSQPRQDMLTAQVCTVVGKQSPYMRDATDPEDIADAKQDLLQKVWKDAGFEKAIRDMAKIAGDTDLAFFRVCPNGPGEIRWDVLHPRNVIVMPPTIEGIEGAACVGHRFNRRRAAIDALQKEGLYYKTTALPAGDPSEVGDVSDEERAGVSLDGEGPDRANDLINLWALIVLLDIDGKGEKKYRATFNQDAVELLSLKPYEFERTEYFTARFIGNPVEFYPSTSVGRNLYPLQDGYNKLVSCSYAGGMMSALKPLVGPKLEDGEKYGKYGFGSYVESDAASQAFSPTVTFAGQPIFALLQHVEKVGDQVARISQNTQGASISETATESSIIAAGVAVGLEEYIANFTEDLPKVAAHTMEIIAKDYEVYVERYGEEVPQEIGAPVPDMGGAPL